MGPHLGSFPNQYWPPSSSRYGNASPPPAPRRAFASGTDSAATIEVASPGSCLQSDGLHNLVNGHPHAVPPLLLLFQLFPSGFGQSIVLRASIVLGLAPFRLELDDGLVFLSRDCALLPVPDWGPERFGQHRPWQPRHPDGEVMESSQEVVRRNLTAFQYAQHMFSLGLKEPQRPH